MTRQRSLRRRADFAATLRSGTRIRDNGVTLAVVPRTGAPGRLGLAVRAPGAVVRNRIKRRLRAAFGDARVEGADIVARADASASEMDYQELVRLFVRARQG